MKYFNNILLWSILTCCSIVVKGQSNLSFHGAAMSILSGGSVKVNGGVLVDDGIIDLQGNLQIMHSLINNSNGVVFDPNSKGVLSLETSEALFHCQGQPILVPNLELQGKHGMILGNDLTISQKLILNENVFNLNHQTLTLLKPEWNENPFPSPNGFFWNGTLSYPAQKGSFRIPTGDGMQQQLLALEIKEHPKETMIYVSWKDTMLPMPEHLEFGNRKVLSAPLPGYWAISSTEHGDGVWDLSAIGTLHSPNFAQAPAADFQLLHVDAGQWETLGTNALTGNSWEDASTLVVHHEAIPHLGNWVLVQTMEKPITSIDESEVSIGIENLQFNGDFLEVYFKAPVDQLDLYFSDLSGRLLAQQSMVASQSTSMSLPQLPDGVYLLTCVTFGKQPTTYKIVYTKP